MLEAFLKQLKEDLHKDGFQVVCDSQKSVAERNELLIGFGNVENGGLILSNKIEGKKTTSVTQYVINQSDAFFEQWKAQFKRENHFRGISLYVEDLSVDTCYATILFFARINGIDFCEFPPGWLRYVNSWEKGDVKSTGKFEKSCGVLLNALSHEFFEVKEVIERDDRIFKIYDQQKILDGFRTCVTFTIELLLEKVDPSSVPVMPDSDYYHRALAICNIEKLEYENLISNVPKIQLLLPLQNSKRRVFVDAIIVTELNVLAALKNFSRMDTKHSFFKTGFGLMALHRPHLEGTGNDIVISVDPTIGVHIKELWEQLEAIEDSRWNGKRPNNKPRTGFETNQPWYIDEAHTLIGAPKALTSKDTYKSPDTPAEEPSEQVIPVGEVVLGPKVTWEEVLEQLWLLYNPVRNLKVQTYRNGMWSHVLELKDIHKSYKTSSKSFIGIKWTKGNPDNYMAITPSLKQYLVACLTNKGREPQMKDLPSEQSFDYLRVPGGFALIHNEGVVFFDDWSNEGVNIYAYYEEFERLLKRNTSITEFQSQVKNEIKDILDKMKNRKRIRKEIVTLSSRLAELKIELQNSIFDTASKSNAYEVNHFREAIEKRWGLNSKLDELYSMVSEIEITIKGVVDSRTNRVIRSLTIVGFPLTLFSSIFSDSIKNVIQFIDEPWRLVLYGVLTVSLMLVLLSWVDKD